MADPYQILGVDRDATDEEIKRAYRRLAKQYHPDANPGDEAAAKKMQEINDAYDQIKNPEKYHGPASGGSQGYNPYGQTGYGYGPFGYGYYQQRQSYNQKYADSHLQAAYNYILYRRYREALNVLAQFEGVKGAEWYYLSALANQGVGNQVTALEHMRKAVSMDPGNQEYLNALDRMEHGGDAYRRQAGNFQGFDLRMNPCTTLCLCMLCNRICPGMGYYFLCC
ncbi:MAG: J domain-containing protein [Ruminococcaceae bacterium]|nr:J domain-containing protein [Oscillospiraceae bacterium]